MDFFDELGKKVSETYQEAKEKATNFSEELKLKSRINNLKEIKTTLYTEIGEIVYGAIKDGKDVDRDAVTVKCDEITKIVEDISKIEADILSFKKMRVCTSCGKKIDFEHTYCPYCGKEQPEVVKQEHVEVKEEPENAVEAEVNTVENSDENKEENNG